MNSIPINRRFVALDSLRGVAALTVVVWHIVLLLLEVSAASPYYPAAKFLRLWQISPLYPLMAGREAVIIFFILSGFVLSLPWVKGNETPYGPFLLKRLCRIYIPYLLAIVLAFLTYYLFERQTISGLAGYIDATWAHPPNIKDIVQHLALVVSFDNEQYALVLWSLVHEMRISIIFPLLMILIMRWRWPFTLAMFFNIGLLGTCISVITENATDYPATLHYIVFFVAGALIAKHYSKLTGLIKQLSKLQVWIVLFVAFMLYTYSRVLSQLIGESYWSGNAEELLVGIGASLLIVWLLSSTSAQRTMEWPPLVFLGRISYSLYLLHPLVILSLIHGFSDRLSVYTLLIAALPLSILLAWLSYRWVEVPSMKLGKWLVTREQREEAVAAKVS